MLMFRWLMVTGAIGFALCGGISLLLPPPPNPVSRAGMSIESRMQVPTKVLATLKRSCYDCHSNETRWPAYSRLWPASSLIYSDVAAGRSAMNFSDWPSMEDAHQARRVSGLLMSGCSAMKSGLMPRKQYLLMHPDAKISAEEAERFCAWTTGEAQAIHSLQSKR